MQKHIKGEAYIFGDNIDTDQIYPGRYLEISDHEEIGRHAMEGADDQFRAKFKKGGIIVAGENFGCGSSREHAVITLKNAGVAALIAKSFARIFYRNAINLGFPVISCEEIISFARQGDIIGIDLEKGVITNFNTNQTAKTDRMSQHVLNIISKGGILPVLIEKLRA